MKIKFREYTLEPEGRNFNLYKLVSIIAETTTKNRVKGETYFVDKNMGWSLRFETAVELIVKDIISERDVVFTLRQYIDEYKKLKDEVLISANI